MAEVVLLNFPMSLLGVWRSEEDDGRTEYDIQIRGGQLFVNAKDFVDGEPYVVTNVSYDAQRIEFDTLMPSTSRAGHIVLTALSTRDRAHIQFTFTDVTYITRI
ncbi:hypothetical protein [Aestuariivirga sp.]|uniref:hypothetical protein n=1 Tax=Aestuariivirga sp. TaxID=2650926 RepID=UPI0039E4E73F